MWLKIYEKKSSIAEDDLESRVDYDIVFVQDYQFNKIKIETTSSGKYQIAIEHGGLNEDGTSKESDWIYDQADTEKLIIEKADALAKKLSGG